MHVAISFIARQTLVFLCPQNRSIIGVKCTHCVTIYKNGLFWNICCPLRYFHVLKLFYVINETVYLRFHKRQNIQRNATNIFIFITVFTAITSKNIILLSIFYATSSNIKLYKTTVFNEV